MHKVMKAEKVLLSNGLKHEIVMTPKEITSDCGMSIRINPTIVNLNKISASLKESKLEFKIFEKDIV